MSRCILAIDQGTTSSRALVLDTEGRVVASAQREFAQHFPRPGWVEHDPLDLWNSQRATVEAALASARVAPRDLAAIGIANQRETTLLWDRASGEPLARAIVWQDRRTADACERMRSAGLEGEIARRTGLLLDPYFSGTKLAWLLDNVAGARARAERGELAFGTVDTWLAWHLCEGRRHVTDRTNASRTLLFNIHTLDWDDELLRLFGVPRACLPQVVPSSIPRGAPELIARLGGFEAPLAGIAGDQQAALFGQACFEPGMAKNTYGTGCFLLMNTGGRPLASRTRLLTTLACAAGGETQYALEGAVFVAGAVVQWLRDELGIIASSNEIEGLAASVPDSGGVYLVPAFTGLGSPYWDAEARGTIVGLTRGSGRAHLARAALESIAFQSAELLHAMRGDEAPPLVELRVDGGATANDLLLQFQADLLGVPVVRPRMTETTALGAAYLAGLGAGVWSSADALRGRWQVDRRFEPRMSRSEAGERMQAWRRAVERSREWARSPP